MAYRNEYKTQSEFNVILERGDDYEGFVVGLGYTWMSSKVILPVNQNGWSPIFRNVSVDESFHTIVSERKYDTSQYAYEKSLMQDPTKVSEKVRDLIVKNKGNNSNGKTYEAKYESLTDLVSAVRDSGSLPAVNKEGPNLEGLAGLGFGIAETAGNWAEKIMDNRGAYLPKQMRFSPKTLPPIIRLPLGNYQVPAKGMSRVRGVGKALGWAGMVLTGYQVVRDVQNGRFAVAGTRIAVAGLAYGVTFIPYVGWVLAIGIGVADYTWGDEFYDWIDNRASELEMWWDGVRLAL